MSNSENNFQDYYWQKGLGSDNSESVESRNVVSPLYRYFDAYRIIKLRSLQGCNILADLDNDEKLVKESNFTFSGYEFRI